ncbi:MAG: hypothetical protein O7G87_07320 [bacterium]|nr:hypothetical protein [bacterium]
MVSIKQKLIYIVFGGVLVLTLQLLSGLVVDKAVAQNAEQASTIKYILSVDYPLGKKADYLAWVKSVSGTLQEPAEVRRIASYDNYFGASPNRFIELEFDNMEAAGRYWGRADVRAVLENWTNHGVNAQVHVMALRGDYTKQ